MERRRIPSRRGGVQRRGKSYGGRWWPKCVPTVRRVRGGGEVPTNCRRNKGMATLTKLGRSRWHCDKVPAMDGGSGDGVHRIGSGTRQGRVECHDLARKWRSGVRLAASSRSGEGKRERMSARLSAPRGGDSEGGGGSRW
jgi:hypothetical protein